jgi:hypothetical protein
MPTIGEPFLRQKYRGLTDFESRMLATYLRRLEGDVTALETQVPVGPGELLPETERDSFRRSWRESSKLKIDAVVTTSSVVQIVEIKDFLRTSYLGQLLMYRYWFEIERETDRPVELWAVAEDMNPSAVQPTRFNGVHIDLTTQQGVRHFEQGLDAQPPFDGLQ